MKHRITAEIEKMKSIKSSAELYLIFFRMVQLFSAVGIVYVLGYVMPLVVGIRDQFGLASSVGPALVVGPLLLCGVQLLLAEAAIRAVARGEFWGTAVGLVLSALMLSRWYFPFAGFGFYCFLNANYQRKRMQNAPAAFRDILASLNLSCR